MPHALEREAPAVRVEDPVLARMTCGGVLRERIVVVAAHPDDETIGLGAQLGRFQDLTLVHLTDGAPEDGHDAHAAGFASSCDYAQARAGELTRALALLGCAPRRHVTFGVSDRSAVLRLPEIARLLQGPLAEATAVVTHAYEGGHPDHDAAAFAVQAACDLLARDGRRPPTRLEFAGYHQAPRGRVTGRFWADPQAPGRDLPVPPAALRRKRAAFAAFASQAEVLSWFDPAGERIRIAPRYDFTRAPPPRAALYDGWGWPLTSAVWREHATRAGSALDLRTVA